MEVLRRSSIFAAEVMEAFDRSPTDKELVAQAKALCRDFIHSRLNRAGIGWSKPEHGLLASGGTLGEVSTVLQILGDELEYLRPNVYRNVARQLNISVNSENVVSDAFLAVAAEMFSTGPKSLQHWPQLCPWFPASLSQNTQTSLGCSQMSLLLPLFAASLPLGDWTSLRWSPGEDLCPLMHPPVPRSTLRSPLLNRWVPLSSVHGPCLAGPGCGPIHPQVRPWKRAEKDIDGLEGITWGKVVSLYTVAGGLAVDSVRQGQPAMVHTIVDCLGEFVRRSLVTWIKRRGGWPASLFTCDCPVI
ncbi:UNVERIFIED_CONTAM: hypothetical protein FKN15_027173 [Acipenser sinensis]